MTTVDLAIVAVMVLSGVLALMRGFTREVFSIVSWGGAAFATLWLFPPMRGTGRGLLSFIGTPWIADGITAGLIFVLTLVALTYLTTKATEKLRGANPGPFDGTAGFIFGLARGFILVVLLYHFYGLISPPKDNQDPKWIAKSAFLPLIKDTNAAFTKLVAKAEQKIPQNPEAGKVPRVDTGSNGVSEEDVERDRESGYSNGSRDDMDRLLSSTNRNPGSNRP